MWKHVTVYDLNPFDIFSFKNNNNEVVITGRILNGSDNLMKIAVMASDSSIQTIMDLPEWAIRGTSMLSQEAELTLARLGYTEKADADTIARLKKILKDKGIIEAPICTILKFVPDLSIPDEAWEVE